MNLGYALLGTAEILVMLIFDIMMSMVMIRFIMQSVKTDFYHPFAQGIVKVTNPILVPFRRVVPGLFGVDVASLVLLVILKAIQLILVSMLARHSINWVMFLLIPVSLVQLAISICFFAIILRALLSWVAPMQSQPFGQLLTDVTEPLLAPFRERLPNFGGIDLSPIVVLLALQILSSFLRLWLGV